MAAVMFCVSKTWMILLLMSIGTPKGKVAADEVEWIVIAAAKIISAEFREKK